MLYRDANFGITGLMALRRPAAACAALLPLPLLLSGCGGGGGGGSSSAPASSPQSASAVTPNGLTATLAEDKNAVSVGDSVAYTMTLTNNTAQAVAFSGESVEGSSAAAVGVDVTVVSSSGAMVYPSNGSVNNAAIEGGPPETLAPGQSLSATITAGDAFAGNVFTASGAYSATATFVLTPLVSGPVSGPVSSSPPSQSTTVGPLTVTVK